jgi:hypothetical protein
MSQRHTILWFPMALPIGVSTGFVSVSLANALLGAAFPSPPPAMWLRPSF